MPLTEMSIDLAWLGLYILADVLKLLAGALIAAGLVDAIISGLRILRR